MKGRERRWPAPAWIAGLVALLAYLPTLGHGFVWDDVTFIVRNEAAHDPARLADSWRHGYGWAPDQEAGADAYLYYRPIISTANTLHWVIGGGRPWVFHLGNILTHALCATLLALLAGTLGLPAAAGTAAAVIFALHPVHAEAVTWVSGRTDLTAACGVLALLALLAARRRGQWRPRPWIATSVIAALVFAALGSKESALAGWVAAVLLVLLPQSGERVAAPARAPALLGLGLGLLAYLLARALVLGPGLVGSAAFAEGATLAGRGTWIERLLLGGHLTLLYVARLIVPHPLTIAAPPALTRPPYPALGGLLGLLVLTAGAVATIAAVRAAPRRRDPALAVGLSLGLLALAPVLQWVPTGEVYGERFLYLPAAGLLLAVGALAAPWLQTHRRPAVWIVAALAVPSLLLLQSRIPDWRDEETLFRSALRVHPDSPRVHALLGSVLAERGRPQEAVERLAAALQLDPGQARARAELGSALINLGRVDEGVAHLERARVAMPQSLTLAKNLGIGWSRQGRFDEAADLLRQAVDRAPRDAGLIEALAMAERKRGRLDEAAALLERAVALDPARRSCYLNLIGLHSAERGDPQAARVWAERFVARFPRDPEAQRVRGLLDPRRSQ